MENPCRLDLIQLQFYRMEVVLYFKEVSGQSAYLFVPMLQPLQSSKA
ncbi:hypothetical protein C8N40_11646 [Pontibacter mucosus]|uniref:Uncharacterized protein n=1 Tax=Pontibacter mucosus TaxID=1649266 RepID=A0A2T5Y3F8_9BACT|nr:hypothetical protein [Pontibacter mucosus]PTX10705.1 hypothetical protein C8N40_11646 [Pontibacter mucosus]